MLPKISKIDQADKEPPVSIANSTWPIMTDWALENKTALWLMILITFYVMITCMQNKRVWIMGIGLTDLYLLGLPDSNIACDATLHDVLVR